MPQLPSHPPHTQVNNIIIGHRYCFTVIFGYYYRYETKNEFHYCHPCHQQLFSSPRRSGNGGNGDTQNDDDSDGDRTGKQCHEVLGNGDRWEEPDMSAMTLYFEAVKRICEGSLLTKHLNI